MSSNPSQQTTSFSPSLPPDYHLLTTVPTVEIYTRIRAICGQPPKSQAAAIAGLPNTLHAVQIQHVPTDTVIGMGRVIGDNGLFYQIVDICVDPAHQRKGLAKAILKELMRWFDETGKHGGYVSLIADGEAPKLYRQFGFEETLPYGTGMLYRIQKSSSETIQGEG